jgi:hypothetical protein
MFSPLKGLYCADLFLSSQGFLPSHPVFCMQKAKTGL